MKNRPLGRFEAEDIQQQVAKVIRGLDYPEPPLDLRSVRELLKLDLQFYSSQDDGVLREVASRIIVAGKQILMRPTILWEAVRKAKLSSLWVPDGRRILLDTDAPKLKHRWNETHEVIHSLTPWHSRYLLGDDAETLKITHHEKLEREANYGAGQMLFLQQRFRNEANDFPFTIQSVRSLHGTFGNTITSTLWRFIEEAHRGVPLVGIVSQHPLRRKADFDPDDPCKYCIESPAFRERFGEITEVALFGILESYCSYARGGSLGDVETLLTDSNGDSHVFQFESFSNTYEVLTLGVYVRPATQSIAVPQSPFGLGN